MSCRIVPQYGNDVPQGVEHEAMVQDKLLLLHENERVEDESKDEWLNSEYADIRCVVGN